MIELRLDRSQPLHHQIQRFLDVVLLNLDACQPLLQFDRLGQSRHIAGERAEVVDRAVTPRPSQRADDGNEQGARCHYHQQPR